MSGRMYTGRMYNPGPTVRAPLIPLYQLGWLGQDETNGGGDVTAGDSYSPPDISSSPVDTSPMTYAPTDTPLAPGETTGGALPDQGMDFGPVSPDVLNMLNSGYTTDQANAVLDAHNSGALSDAGYNQIVSGNVAPGNLDNFLANDPGASEPSSKSTSSAAQPSGGMPASPKSGGGSPKPPTAQQIAKALQALTTPPPTGYYRPSPVVATPTISTFASGQTMIAGVPNWAVFAAALALVFAIGGRK